MSARRRTPLTCPICRKDLKNTQIRKIGDVTANLKWDLHSGRCEEHGWFQAEMIATPPREIFPVTKPGGVARKMVVGDTLFYSFPTVWDSVRNLRQGDESDPYDPYDPELWAVDWSRFPVGEEVVLSST